MGQDDTGRDDSSQDRGRTTFLVREAQQGSRGALEELFQRYLPRVRRIVALRMGHRMRELADEEDVVQDAMVRALQGLEAFETRSEGGFRNWLARCVENVIIDRRRIAMAKKRGGGKVRRFGDFPTEGLSDSIFAGREPTPSAIFRAREAEDRLEEALLALSPEQRELVVLRHLCKMSYDEIARELGNTQESAVRRACARAVQRLMALYGDET